MSATYREEPLGLPTSDPCPLSLGLKPNRLFFTENGDFFKFVPGPHLLTALSLGGDSILPEPGRPQRMQPLGKLLGDCAGVVSTSLRSDLLHKLHRHPELV